MSFVSVIPECALPMFRVLARSEKADERLWATDVLLRAFDSAPDEVRPIWVDLVNDVDDCVRARAAAYLQDLYKRSAVDPNWARWTS
jgi:hypothetical protein